MALWDERGLNTARYANIISAVANGKSIEECNKTWSVPLDEEDIELYNDIAAESKKADAEGRYVIFDIPFDPDDRYDGIYNSSVDEMAEEVGRMIEEDEKRGKGV